MEAITYAESDSALLNGKELKSLGISNVGGFKTTFNGVYNSAIEGTAEAEARAVNANAG
ncbi:MULTISPECIES: hypothetical protein [Alphaproteobacteria]